MKTYYEVLQVGRNAAPHEIRQAFRQQIARYHPDKVQHLGAEFQELAQVRSAELTTAYKTLTDPERRAEYDRSLLGEGAGRIEAPAAGAAVVTPRPPASKEDVDRRAGSFEDLRSGRDLALKRAALARLDRLFSETFTIAGRPATSGFDLSCVPKLHRFDRPRSRPWLLAKFVSRLDAAVVSEVWAQAVRANAVQKAEVFVFVLASDIASRNELAAAIEINRDLADPGRRITIVPIDLRDWHALVPTGADPVVKTLAARLGIA